ncbi:MAG: cyclic nucleotide-binding domain-containing protein [Desulfobacteraceae bacterium]|nr:cyclic nucleotide-binding domain-containing protein [Desulfobacteraceae bacterium]
MNIVVQQEELIQRYLDEGNREAAIKLLFELVTACAKEKKFGAAKELRDRMFEIDPMALNEIIRSGELIEEEKNESIDREHREIWAKLYQGLSMEEANALFYAMRNAKYSTDGLIYSQGEWKPRLFFLNSGRAKIVYFQNGREVLLKVLHPGQVVGEDAFFSTTNCTTSMMALSEVDLSYLDADHLKAWKVEYPVLESKLFDFCSRGERIKDLIKARDLDRRLLKRMNAGGKALVHLMTSSDNPVGKPFKVEMSDISRGGVCFWVRISKKETASLLLAQRVQVSYLNSLMDSSKAVNAKGIIVAVRFHPFEDCSVNVKFDTLLPAALIDELERLAPECAAGSPKERF